MPVPVVVVALVEDPAIPVGVGGRRCARRCAAAKWCVEVSRTRIRRILSRRRIGILSALPHPAASIRHPQGRP